MNLAERIKNMTPREIEDAEWLMVAQTLEQAKAYLREIGRGENTWLDGAIGVANERARAKQ